MTNREKFKDDLDEILADAIAVKRGEPVQCEECDCSECKFSRNESCIEQAKAWLNAEYQEPPVDWSKVPIDTPVLASSDGEKWYRRYFAGMRDGKPEAYDVGATSWSVDNNRTCAWKYMRLAEGNE